MSASAFHEVVGQALKNIGNMNINSSQLDAKKVRWSSYYNDTKIALKRIGDTVENGASCYLKALNHPNSSNHIYLVVNYISKAELTNELNKLKDKISTRPQVIQLFWLLSSFISMCKELGIQAHIICKP
ncbi:hypothetical protein M3231_17615 [Neobacillus mesonae]|nr:hypothetical protein [Neobacillus mesonae]